jgi:hypothetical protein
MRNDQQLANDKQGSFQRHLPQPVQEAWRDPFLRIRIRVETSKWRNIHMRPVADHAGTVESGSAWLRDQDTVAQ